MDETMKEFQQQLVELETEAERLLLARHQLVENDKGRNGNREALTGLRKRARTTKTSILSPFESIMREIGGPESRPLVKEVCSTCGNHDSSERTWMMFPGTDVFARIPFHAAHTILETDQERLDFEAKKLQTYVKDKSLLISERGALADKISPGVLKSLVTLTDKRKRLMGGFEIATIRLYMRLRKDGFLILSHPLKTNDIVKLRAVGVNVGGGLLFV